MIKAPAYPVLISCLTLVLVVLGVLSMLVGASARGTADLLRMLVAGDAETAWMIMREIRLPRTALALMEGATLGLAGAALQGFLRNPLSDPAVIGVSSAASLGCVAALYSGLSAVFPLALPVMGIAGALACVLVLQFLAGGRSVLTLILAGVAISSLCGALMSLALNLSPNPYAANEIIFWLMGSVTDRSLDHLALSGPFMLVGWSLLAFSGRSLDALSLGEDTAASLGVDLRRTRTMIVFGVATCVGAGAAVTGGIGFIGLIAPHLLRGLVGHSPSRLLLASALGGAALLAAADIVVRVLATGPELKLGVVTALIGAPFFLYLILRTRGGLDT
ncbi:MAG: iron ABC transporter permease [Alphaproteobacteria bacterium]|nr:iron ABC transporter permease [Alphaproteobacteria bacterium]